MKVTVLGCGASGGVPLVGCDCPVCNSENPRNRRTRVSILIETKGKKILVDTSPDLREQCLRHNITSVDAILYTHAHADHIHGIDDVRSLNYNGNSAIDMYADPETLEELVRRFPYVFAPRTAHYGWYKPAMVPHALEAQHAPLRFKVADEVEVIAFPQWHGDHLCLGYRVEDFAYSTDVNKLPEESLQELGNLRVWLVDCLRYNRSPTHAHLEMTLDWVERIKPERAILTHMAHELDYDTLHAELPDGVEPAYDGMVIAL